MIRLLALPALCASLHTVGLGPMRLEQYLPLTSPQIDTFGWYLKWIVTFWTVREINAILNRWAEDRWVWNSEPLLKDWKNEVAVVTGGASGIGAHVVKKLVARGIRVAILDVGSLSDTITPDERKLVRHYTCDITSRDAISTAAQSIRSDLGTPSILINNAGIGNASTILEVSPERLRKLFEVNLISQWSTVQEFLPDMISRKKGHIMSVASLASFCTIAGSVDYSCSKSALLSFHEGLTVELKHRYNCPEIKTSIVHPNWTKSALTSHPSMQEGLQKLGVKIVEAEDVAEAMVQQIIKGKNGQLVLGPSLSPRIRAMPTWLQEIIRDKQAYIVSGTGTTAVE